MKPTDKAIEAGLSTCPWSPRVTQSIVREILTAAYAAQFKSDDYYMGLIKALRSGLAYSAKNNRAADAIEALLAERDDAIVERGKWEAAYKEITDTYVKIEETTVDKLKKVEAERDALAARLAPVEDEALVEIVAREMTRTCGDDEWVDKSWISWEAEARAAIAAIRPHIEAAERERCAKVAEKYENEKANYLLDASSRAVATLWRMEIAAAIRSRK